MLYLFSSIRLLPNSVNVGGGRWYLERILFIYPVLLNRDSFFTPPSIFAVLFPFIQLLFIQYCFSSLHPLFKLIISFNKSLFYTHKPLCCSNRLLCAQRISVVN